MKKHIQSEHEMKQNYPCPQCSFKGKTSPDHTIGSIICFSTFIDGICFTRGQSQGKQFQRNEVSETTHGDTNDVTDQDIDGKPGKKQPTCTAAAADEARTEAAGSNAATTAYEEATKFSAKVP